MNASQIVEVLKSKKGQHVPAVWTRKIETPKDYCLTVTKKTTAFIRAGIDYANLASVKDGIATGERGEVEKLPWGEWITGLFPFAITHKGAEYIRLYPATFANLQHAETEYFIENIPVTKAQAFSVAKSGEIPVKDVSLETFMARPNANVERQAQLMFANQEIVNLTRQNDGLEPLPYQSIADCKARIYLQLVDKEKNEPSPACFTIKAENLVSIG